MKYNRICQTTFLIAVILTLTATMASAQQATPPTSCDILGAHVELTADSPKEAVCEGVRCWIYTYEITSGPTPSLYAQSVPGLGPEDFEVYVGDNTFPSISVREPAEGTSINKASFGENIHERRIIDFSSNPSGNPPKFGYAVNQSGVGWTSLYFKSGNLEDSCAIAGPDFLDTPYIKPTIKWQLFGDSRVRLEINYQTCTYKAFQEYPLVNGAEYELTQLPQGEITITVADEETGVPESGPVREGNSPGKCDEFSSAYGTGTCSVYLLGGTYVKIPYGCKP